MIKAIIFDMDGVIVDSTSHDFKAWGRIFAESGKKLTMKKFKSFLGKRSAEIIKQYVREDVSMEEADKMTKKKDLYFVESVEEGELQPFAGLHELLEMLTKNNYKIALATGANKGKAEMVLAHLKVRKYFNVVASSDVAGRGKPDPAVFLLAAKELGIEPEQCMVIEDSPLGIQAAKAAKMKCIAVITTHDEEELFGANKIVNEIKEIKLGTIESV